MTASARTASAMTTSIKDAAALAMGTTAVNAINTNTMDASATAMMEVVINTGITVMGANAAARGIMTITIMDGTANAATTGPVEDSSVMMTSGSV